MKREGNTNKSLNGKIRYGDETEKDGDEEEGEDAREYKTWSKNSKKK